MTAPHDSPDGLAAVDEEIERLESLRTEVGGALEVFYSSSEIEARRDARIRILGAFYLGRPLDARHLPGVVSLAERTDEQWLFDSDVLGRDGVAVDGDWVSEGGYHDPDDFLETEVQGVGDVATPPTRNPADEWLFGE